MGLTSKKNKKKEIKMKRMQRSLSRKDFFLNFSFFSFFLRFMETCPSDFVGINTESAQRDEGYA